MGTGGPSLSDSGVSALQIFRDALIGLPVSHFWRGYGSIKLAKNRTRPFLRIV
jgi:hypothetical protein